MPDRPVLDIRDSVKTFNQKSVRHRTEKMDTREEK